MDKSYYNLICEEIESIGGKTIHLDKNVGSLEDLFTLLSRNIEKYPNAKWEIYPMYIK